METWKWVPGYEGLYEVSDRGNVRSYRRPKKPSLNKLYIDPRGYIQVALGHKVYWAHRLVAQAFVPNPRSRPQVHHKDHNPSNNAADNLEWVTGRQNTLYAYKRGLIKPPHPKGEDAPSARLTNADVIAIRKQYEEDESVSYRQLAKKYGVAIQTIYSIVRRRTWTHI